MAVNLRLAGVLLALLALGCSTPVATNETPSDPPAPKQSATAPAIDYTALRT